MPKTKLLSRSSSDLNLSEYDRESSPPHVLQVYKDCDSDEEGARRNRIGSTIPYQESSRQGQAAYGVNSAKKHRSAPNVAQLASYVSLPSRRTAGFDVRNDDTLSHAPSTITTNAICPVTPIGTPIGTPLGTPSGGCKMGKNKLKSNVKSSRKSPSDINGSPCQNDEMYTNMRVIAAKRSDSCFFCLKNGPQLLVPACLGWLPRIEPLPSAASSTTSTTSGTTHCDCLHSTLPIICNQQYNPFSPIFILVT